MTHFAPWQKVAYYAGEALLIAGLVWALYERFVASGPNCPLLQPGTILQPFSLIIAGIALDALPLHPFGAAPYLRAGLRHSAAGVVWWLLVLAGVGFALYSVITAAAPPTWWLVALVPAFLWYFTAVVTGSDGKPAPPAKAPPAPPRGNKKTKKEERDEQ